MADLIKNVLTVNKGLAKKILKNQKEFDFNSIVKMPDSLTDEEVRKWTIANWGTLSNAWDSVITFDENSETFTIFFDTAWTPPEKIIERLARISENENLVWLCISETNDILTKWTKDGCGNLIKTRYHHKIDPFDDNVYQLIMDYDIDIGKDKKL